MTASEDTTSTYKTLWELEGHKPRKSSCTEQVRVIIEETPLQRLQRKRSERLLVKKLKADKDAARALLLAETQAAVAALWVAYRKAVK